MLSPLAIDWNDENEARHVAKHGIRFDLAAAVFLDADRLEAQDLRKSYDPPRYNVVGAVDGRVINVTVAIEGDLAIVISARPANRKERRRYAA